MISVYRFLFILYYLAELILEWFLENNVNTGIFELVLIFSQVN